MNEKNLLDFTEGKSIYVKRDILAKAIEYRLRNALLPEITALREKLTKLVKNKENAVKLLIALRRSKESYSENALFVDSCLDRIHALEEEAEDLSRTMKTLPSGDVTVKLTDDQARYYGL